MLARRSDSVSEADKLLFCTLIVPHTTFRDAMEQNPDTLQLVAALVIGCSEGLEVPPVVKHATEQAATGVDQ